MKRTIWLFGIILGTIISVNMVIMVAQVYNSPDVKPNDVIGYAAMVIVFSLIFVGVRNYRNKEAGGIISFGKAFKIGALIVLVASTIYVGVWMIYYYFFVPDFMDRYMAMSLQHCAADEYATKKAELENMKEMYKNPLFVILFTYLEIVPVGLIVALISALILKKKPANTPGITG